MRSNASGERWRSCLHEGERRSRTPSWGACATVRATMALFPPVDASPEEVRALLSPVRSDFSVAVHSFGNAFAVGAIIRVAHSFLAREVIIVGDEPHYAKASMGMEKYESIVRVADEEAF